VATHKLLLLPGDGIGKEIMAELKTVISWFNRRETDIQFECEEDLVGGSSFDVQGG